MRNLIIFTILVGSHAAMAANKCTAADGSVSFQDSPCAATTRSEAVKLDYVPPSTERDAKIGAAIAVGRVRTGMTAAEVKRSWGSPSKINASVGSYGRHEQWVYERENYKNQYLYIENGILTSMQTPE
jgi:phosphoribosylformylglycinamidine (FGAM) synthase-like enzyme